MFLTGRLVADDRGREACEAADCVQDGANEATTTAVRLVVAVRAHRSPSSR